MLKNADGRPSGFDYMRLSLSVFVVLSHTLNVSYGMDYTVNAWQSGLGFFFKPILPMFFLLSGFLVAGSLLRCKTLISFLTLRALRIYPALAVEVVLSALLLGPILTDIPLSEYFTSHEFFRYLLNVTGHISYELPGVFLENPTPRIVNQQLWTVPYELYCYLTISIISLFGLRKNNSVIFLAIFSIFLLFVFRAYFTDSPIFGVNTMPTTGKGLILYFLTGVAFFLLRDKIRASRTVLLLSTTSAPLILYFFPAGDFLALPLIGYTTAYLGSTNFRRIFILKYADCSYGIFLYGFVVQQTVANLFQWSHQWYWNAVISVPASIVIGLISWELIEKPIMQRKAIAFSIEDVCLRTLSRINASWNEIIRRHQM